MSRRTRVLAGLTVLLATSLTACWWFDSGPDNDADARAAVEEYVALLGGGKAEAADALDTYDTTASRCPELFTDEVYGTVTERPTDLHIESVFLWSGDPERADVEATVSLRGHTQEAMNFRLVLDDGRWLIDNEAPRRGLEIGGVTVQLGSAAGEFTVQGRCATPRPDGYADVQFSVYPGTWTVAYTDPAGVGAAEPASVSVLGVFWSFLTPLAQSAEPVEVLPTLSPDAVDAVDAAVAELAQACVAEGLTGPSCPPDVASRVDSPPSGIEVTPVRATVEDALDGSWNFSAALPVTWLDETGVRHDDTALWYHGTVTIDDTGAAVLVRNE